jgi:hypothetical protein
MCELGNYRIIYMFVCMVASTTKPLGWIGIPQPELIKHITRYNFHGPKYEIKDLVVVLFFF